jgi:hypothetical protein
MKKKSYNPFKMWGSYAGILIVFLFLIFSNSISIQKWSPSCLGADITQCKSSAVLATGANYDEAGLPYMSCQYHVESPEPYFERVYYSADKLEQCTVNKIVYSNSIFFLLIYGFLIGWGIHSLVRRYK